MKRNLFFTVTLIIAILLVLTSLTSWKQQDTGYAFPALLSDYHIFKGDPRNLEPEPDFHTYTLATPLFTDYAEKQRLIHLPEATKMTPAGEDLPNFPDGAILVKTFYYYHSKQDTTGGRRIIETRIMTKSAGTWYGATYIWNETQTDAVLQKNGSNTSVNWITATGEKRTISYHVPSPKECKTCHNTNGDGLQPIGLKLRNLNIGHQLESFRATGLLNESDSHQLPATARAFDNNYPLPDQARAYLDMNCAHCHNPNGYARRTGLFLTYNLPLEATGILKKKDNILNKFQKGKMPLLGTTIVHEEGLQLLKGYLTGLN